MSSDKGPDADPLRPAAPQSSELQLPLAGGMATCRWDFPESLTGFFPVAVFLSVGAPDERRFEKLAWALRGLGIATFRCDLGQAEPSARNFAALYSRCLDHPRIVGELAILVAFGERADLVVRRYYDLYSVRPPLAAVLLSSTVQAFQLSNLTCPFLLVHGQGDRLFEHAPYSRILEGVAEHQSRYGDATAHALLPGLDRELGSPGLDGSVIRLVADWLGSGARNVRRAGERAA
jgi:hypothetical protein